MIETKDITVPDGDNEVKYKVTLFSATKGLSYLNKLKSIAGPAVIKGLSGEDADALTSALDSLVEGIDSNNLEGLILEIIKGYVLNENGQQLDFNNEFAGRYHVLFGILKEVLTLNYGSIFLALGGLSLQNQ